MARPGGDVSGSFGGISGVCTISLVLMLAHPADGKTDRVASGTWGGQGIGMDVSETGARFDFDCAHGSIEAPLRLDETGKFDLPGTYVPEGPGPTRRNDARGQAVRYAGKVDGDTMTLTITLTGDGKEIGTFSLVRGRLPHIRKCG